MSAKIVTFGVLLMRLTTPGNLRLPQTRCFDVNFGGSEANVAISIATYGGQVSFLTSLPDNPLGDVCLMKLREHSVDTSMVMRSAGGRLGTYIMEKAADMRAGSVIYDRKGSAFSQLKPGMIDWEKVLHGAEIFHWSGIVAALTPDLADVCREGIETAQRMGVKVSCDINYRKNLWQYGKRIDEVMLPLMQQCDIFFGSSDEYTKAMGLAAPEFVSRSAADSIDTAAFDTYCRAIRQQLPRCQYLFIAMRHVITSEHHTLGGVLFADNRLYTSKVYEVSNVIDSLGVGDAFVGGMLYAIQHYADNQTKLNFATAASVLKNTIVGDYNMVSVAEVERLLQGDNLEVKR